MPMITYQVLVSLLSVSVYMCIGMLVILAMDASARFVGDTSKVRDGAVLRAWLLWPLFVSWLLWRAYRRG